MGTRSKVSLVKCKSYDPAEVQAAIHQSLELLGGIREFVKPGQKVLLKVNAVIGKEPDSAVCTHPSIVSAVVKEVIAAGATVLAGDSCGNVFGNISEIMGINGIKRAAEAAGAKMLLFEDGRIAEFGSPSGNRRVKKIRLAKSALEADVIINLPKLKTHNLTLFTGAIKNMYGMVPGFEKGNYHKQAIRAKELSEVVVDIFQLSRPALSIMDAVVGMEGHGPAGGEPRKLGLIIASADAVALDAAASYLIGFDPLRIYTTAIAFRRGLGEALPDRIEYLGEPISDLVQKDWKKSSDFITRLDWIPPYIFYLIKPLTNLINVNPGIDQEKCTQCMVCVNNCPAKTIDYFEERKQVVIDLEDCIHCFCCHELCAYKAIELKRTWLMEKLGLGDV